jgi:hypothetical protein
MGMVRRTNWARREVFRFMRRKVRVRASRKGIPRETRGRKTRREG